MIGFPADPGHRSDPQRHVGLFQVRPPGAAPECGAGHDAEAPMVLYGFLAGRGALSAAREDYSKASCWLWNVKCWDGRSRSVTGESLDLWIMWQKRTGLFSRTALQLLQSVPADPRSVALAAL